MKTKLLLSAALIGAASLSAQAGVHFGFSFGLPLPPLPVIVVSHPAPVYYTAPACPAPTVVVEAPACPGPEYVWAPGYWSNTGHGSVWVAGNWNRRPVQVAYDRGFDRGYNRGYEHGYDRGGYDHGYDHGGYRR